MKEPSRKNWVMTAIVSIAVISGGIGAVLFASRPASRGETPSAATVASNPAISTVPSASSDVLAEKSATSPQAASAPVSMAAEVDRLSKSGDPKNAYAAYKLLRQCMSARETAVAFAQETDPVQRNQQSRSPTPEKACGDIGPGQIASRLQFLAKAGEAGVHGAMAAFTAEGPEGRGMENLNPTDPAVIEWQERIRLMTEASVRTGDPITLMSLSNRYNNCDDSACTNRNPAKALTYWVAYAEMQKVLTGKEVVGSAGVIERISRSLTPAEATAAIAAGKLIVERAQGKQ